MILIAWNVLDFSSTGTKHLDKARIQGYSSIFFKGNNGDIVKNTFKGTAFKNLSLKNHIMGEFEPSTSTFRY